MKMLLLNGHGINMRVDGAKLHVKDGRFSATEDPEEYVFSPKRMDIDSIVVYGRSGSLSLEASISFTLRLTENAPNSIVPTF